ncbi:hypothetical protein EZI45_19365 [Delftia tsuruhatensis]|nr:hypothetical protein EZI45_19365 [Delftia tsuruhatensis]
MPRVRAELIEQGISISRQRVARLMRLARIQGISRRRGFTITTRQDNRVSPANDLVKRQFKASGPNQLWVADIPYPPTWTGFLYLAVVIDVWSRSVVGWSMGERMTTDLVFSCSSPVRVKDMGNNSAHIVLLGSSHILFVETAQMV